jgi:antitoxin MazE
MEVQSIKKWGNSAGVRIPAPILKASHLKIDAQVEITEKDGCIILKPLPEEAISLEAMCAQITPEMLHEEINFGGPQGSEAW